MKKYTLEELKNFAKEVFQQYPEATEVYTTEDGNIFLVKEKGSAFDHAKKSELEKPFLISKKDLAELDAKAKEEADAKAAEAKAKAKEEADSKVAEAKVKAKADADAKAAEAKAKAKEEADAKAVDEGKKETNPKNKKS
jgi:membrane protein involved in colicin uptake